MIDVHSRLSTSGLAGRLLLQVHDELVLETPADEAESLAELVVHVRRHAAVGAPKGGRFVGTELDGRKIVPIRT